MYSLILNYIYYIFFTLLRIKINFIDHISDLVPTVFSFILLFHPTEDFMIFMSEKSLPILEQMKFLICKRWPGP